MITLYIDEENKKMRLFAEGQYGRNYHYCLDVPDKVECADGRFRKVSKENPYIVTISIEKHVRFDGWDKTIVWLLNAYKPHKVIFCDLK